MVLLRIGTLLLVLCLAPWLLGDEKKEKKAEARPNTLTAKEIADGWILIFDGETTFGWKIDGEAKVENGALVLGGTKATWAEPNVWLGDFALSYEVDWRGKADPKKRPRVYHHAFNPRGARGTPPGRYVSGPEEEQGQFKRYHWDNFLGGIGKAQQRYLPLAIPVPAGSQLLLRSVKVRPLRTEPLFNGKDLTGWKVFKGNPKQERSKFSVTKEGWLNVKDGPGDLQTEKAFANFVLQLDCISNGDRLNSGVFFRCLPDKYQQGYEAQVHNGWLDRPKEIAVDDYDPVGKRSFKRKVTTTAMDFGTGAIYRRQPARRAVAKDKEWFTMTVVANGRHFATWVNGIQQVDWTDHRPANDNARQGYRAKAGAISLQGHDPTTDLSFRNLRIGPLP